MSPNGVILCLVYIGFFLNLYIPKSESFRLKMSKIECTVLDKSVMILETCRVRAVSRDLQYATLDIHYLELPITQFKGDFRFMKRANGYKPFLYNFTFRCNFLKYLNPVTNIVWSWFKDNTNINHSCPINTDFHMPRLENVYLQDALQALPIPSGEYALLTAWVFNNKPAAQINFYGIIS